jgi:hypothetical protein
LFRWVVELKAARVIDSFEKNSKVLSSSNRRTFIIPSTSLSTFLKINAFIAKVIRRQKIYVRENKKEKR